jgi:hypothetical protein
MLMIAGSCLPVQSTRLTALCFSTSYRHRGKQLRMHGQHG